jgi:hypothetical protein
MAQQTPPPYIDITGLYVEDPKHVDTNFAGYDGNASPGQLVVDTTNYNLYVGNSLGNLNLVGGGGGSTTWATLGDKDNASGPTEIALGQDAGTGQGQFAIAVGGNAGNTSQGLAAIAVGYNAGVTGQGIAAVAIGGGAGVTNQGGNAVALGQSAGIDNQGTEALALGSQAGTLNQAASSIVINASGAPLENTVTGTLVVKPVRFQAGPEFGTLPPGFFKMAYNPTTGEIIYWE